MYVEAFINRTFFSTRLAGFLSGDAAYAPGDELELCYAAERPDLAGLSPEDVAQTVFGKLNPADYEKPHSLAFPSLSVGDMVSCRNEAEPAGAWSLAVEAEGFSPAEPPVFASAAEHAAYRRKVGGCTFSRRSGVVPVVTVGRAVTPGRRREASLERLQIGEQRRLQGCGAACGPRLPQFQRLQPPGLVQPEYPRLGEGVGRLEKPRPGDGGQPVGAGARRLPRPPPRRGCWRSANGADR